jgi:hypothetical protein
MSEDLLVEKYRGDPFGVNSERLEWVVIHHPTISGSSDSMNHLLQVQLSQTKN